MFSEKIIIAEKKKKEFNFIFSDVLQSSCVIFDPCTKHLQKGVVWCRHWHVFGEAWDLCIWAWEWNFSASIRFFSVSILSFSACCLHVSSSLVLLSNFSILAFNDFISCFNGPVIFGKYRNYIFDIHVVYVQCLSEVLQSSCVTCKGKWCTLVKDIPVLKQERIRTGD